MSSMAEQTRGVLPILLLAAGIATSDVSAQEVFLSRCGAGVHEEVRSGWIWLPEGEIFCPLAADPKADRSFVSYLRGDFATIADPEPGAETDIGSVGLSDGVAIFRSAGTRPGDGFQLGLSGSVFAQFDLGQPSFDLINADYLVGLPLTYRSAGFTGRLRVYHQRELPSRRRVSPGPGTRSDQPLLRVPRAHSFPGARSPSGVRRWGGVLPP